MLIEMTVVAEAIPYEYKMSSSAMENTVHNRPENVGSSTNIPDDVFQVSRLSRNDIIAWTTVDPTIRDRIGMFTCCQHFGIFLALPCFWPHLIILSPCLLAAKISADNAIKSSYWILTHTELKIVVMNHNIVCPGCCRTGDTVKTIPLDTITDCGTAAQISGCGGGCCDVPTIYVDTASSGISEKGSKHEAVGYGLAGYDWFVSEILSRRNIHRVQPFHGINNNSMDRGEGAGTTGSLENRIQQLREMQNLGMISAEEYEKKRLAIIASI